MRKLKRFCKCGCKQVTTPGRIYIWGHNQRGKPSGFKGGHHTEDGRNRISKANSGKNHPMYGKFHTEHTKIIMSNNKRELYKDPVRRKFLSDMLKKQWEDPEYRKKQVENIRNREKDPIFKKSKSERLKKRWKDPQERKIMSGKNRQKAINNWKDPECRERMSGPNSGNWNGGTSFEPYDSSFNKRTKEYIRRRDNYICQKCGLKENGRAHSVHHINYNKKDPNCNWKITLCISCNAKVNNNREYWKHYFRQLLLYRAKKEKFLLRKFPPKENYLDGPLLNI